MVEIVVAGSVLPACLPPADCRLRVAPDELNLGPEESNLVTHTITYQLAWNSNGADQLVYKTGEW